MPEIYYTLYSSPIGDLYIGEYDRKICLCDWSTDGMPRTRTLRSLSKELGSDLFFTAHATPLINNTINQLNEYFHGVRREFSLPLKMIGTPFRRMVWENISKIGYGDVVFYSALLPDMSGRLSARAIGSAVGANPMSILIPCHRVIRKSPSTLTSSHPSLHSGYAGGVENKLRLLALENKFK